MNLYYLEPKLWRWLHDEYTHTYDWKWDNVESIVNGGNTLYPDEDFSAVPTPGDGEADYDEEFDTSNNLIEHPEVCLAPSGVEGASGPVDKETGQQILWEGELKRPMWLPHGNAGWYKWRINLPKKPRGNINIVVQCGLLKPNTYAQFGEDTIDTCAGETGEILLAGGLCARADDKPGKRVLKDNLLPTVEAVAYPDPTNGLPFHLTAFKTPSGYGMRFVDHDGDPNTPKAIGDESFGHTILDGGNKARIALKACQPESIFTKIPVEGQVNQLGEVETALEPGDEIEVRLNFPNGHIMDAYCGKYSVKVMGLGEPFSDSVVEEEL
jgi:hypothetical protein